jgi:hypothetical protein
MAVNIVLYGCENWVLDRAKGELKRLKLIFQEKLLIRPCENK